MVNETVRLVKADRVVTGVKGFIGIVKTVSPLRIIQWRKAFWLPALWKHGRLLCCKGIMKAKRQGHDWIVLDLNCRRRRPKRSKT